MLVTLSILSRTSWLSAKGKPCISSRRRTSSILFRTVVYSATEFKARLILNIVEKLKELSMFIITKIDDASRTSP